MKKWLMMLCVLLCLMAGGVYAEKVCTTLEEIRQEVARQVLTGTQQITFYYSEALAPSLSSFKNAICAAGIRMWSGTYNSGERRYVIRDLELFPDFTRCTTEAEVASKLWGCRSLGTSDFSFSYPASMAEEQTWDLLHRLGVMNAQSCRTWDDARVIMLQGVEYFPNYKDCATDQEIVDWLNTCRAYGQTDISFRYPASLQAEAADRWAFLQSRGVRTGDNCWYYESARVLYVKQAEFFPCFKDCATNQEIMDWLNTCRACGQMDIAFRYPASLQAEAADRWTFLTRRGVKTGETCWYYESARVLYVVQAEFYPDFRICASEQEVRDYIAESIAMGRSDIAWVYPQSCASLMAKGSVWSFLRSCGVADASVYPNDDRRIVSLVNLKGSSTFVECADAQAVDRLLDNAYTSRSAVFSFRYPQSMARQLSAENGLAILLHTHGIDGCTWNMDESARVVQLSNVTYFAHYTECASEAEIAELVSACKNAGYTEFAFTYPSGMDGIMDTDNEVIAELHRLGMNNFQWTHYAEARVVKVTNVTYFAHYAECASEAEIAEFVSACKNAGYTEFAFTYPSSMDGIMDTDNEVIAELHRLGMNNFRWNHYEEARVVKVVNAVYYPVMYTCSTVRQVVEQVKDCSERLLSSFAIVLPRNGAVQMANSDWNEIFHNNGLWTYDWYTPEGAGVMYIENIKYRLGYAAVRKAAMGRMQDMTTTERRLYDMGVKLVNQAKRAGCSSMLEIEVYLHDYIAANVHYELSEEGDMHDTAEGALLYGVAECDGYSDAFYLLCSLAGLEVGFQHGDTIDSADDSAHLWNTIRINGRWFFVDMTWDDVDDDTYGTLNTYRYMNVGPNFMPRHIFSQELSNVQVQDGFDWDNFVYTAQESSMLPAAVFTEAPGQWFEEWQREGRRVVHVMIPGVITADEFNSVVYRDYNGGTYYYYYEFNGNTIFDVYLK